ncbi:tether containing UBX domain for GLUT4 [Anopheles maculipalpis]|uniref:tether containing UBX domain for GLUT4 n=1 Tax=Anopheles maculipalpis TaxID=1496333 RepID=UPI002158F8FE|nr:tether containing UBX domain for GLUT4 [Anopheles maculipalpis]
MATRTVTVLTVHGRRHTVKVEQNMTILEILETVCRKYSFPQDLYDLVHHNKVLDLSIMYRFSGIPNNALLVMAKAKQTRTEDDVIVQLQLEDGTRSDNGTFKPSQTLLDVLVALCPARAIAEAHPVLVYMRREVYWEQLATTTLKSLGLTRGRAALRLLKRLAEQSKVQANVSAPLPQTVRREAPAKPAAAAPSSEAIPAAASSVSEAVMIASPMEPVPTDSQPPPVPPTEESTKDTKEPLLDTISMQHVDVPRSEAKILILGEREAILYHASTAVRDQTEVTDSFFELTVPELMQLYKQLQDRVKAFEDAPLLTGELRELERNQQLLSNMDRCRQAVIRVQFPDRHVLQGVFQVHETVGHVVQFVRGYLADSKQSFYLYTTPPKVVLQQPNISLIDADCFPQVLLHFSLDASTFNDSTIDPVGFCLKPELLGRLSNATGAGVLAARTKRYVAAGTSSTQETMITAGNTEKMVSYTHDTIVASSSKRIPNRNFRQSSSTPAQSTSEREAKILKFLKK